MTALTGAAQRNLDFYTRVLGLRLTAKTVNQDDPSVYYLFYGDELARPGADLTFFEYPFAKPGRSGAGMVHRIVWRVASPSALDFWVASMYLSPFPRFSGVISVPPGRSADRGSGAGGVGGGGHGEQVQELSL